MAKPKIKRQENPSVHDEAMARLMMQKGKKNCYQ